MSFFKKLFGGGKKEVEKKIEETKQAAQEAVEKVEEAAANLQETVAEKATEIKENVVEQTTEVKESVADKVSDIQENIAEKTEAVQESVSEKASETKAAIEEKVEAVQKTIVPPPPSSTSEPAPKKEESKGVFGGIFNRKKDLNKGMEKTKTSFFGKLSRAVAGKSTVDEEVLDEVEQVLISSDVGLDTTIKIIERIEARVAKDKYLNTSELNRILRDEIVQLLAENNTQDIQDFSIPIASKPYVMLVVGVNGVGKTTTIGKLAHQFTKEGKKVVIGAGDTFRAAAVGQLEIWSKRVGCEFFSKGMYTDPAAVAYETAKYAQENNCDVAIIDTAGRLHTKVNLMKELGKIKRSVGKSLEGAPHDVMLVLDATTGQNAIEQATKFTNATDVSCLALTKLDGTAKGGVAIGISDQFKIPIKYIGIGEGMEHLQVFNKKDFVESIFGEPVG